MEKLKDIIRNNNMSTRPEFYSGRGAILCDLTPQILFGIHKELKNVFGEKAAIGFVNMVAGIKVLSATAFLNGLYELFNNDWEYNTQQPHSISVRKNEDGNYDSTSGIIGVMESLFSNGRDETQQIKSHFLYCNGVKPTESLDIELGIVYQTY